MSSKKLPDHLKPNNTKQEPLIPPIDRLKITKENMGTKEFGRTTYKPEYDDIVFKLLATSDDAKNQDHCCNALRCSRVTLHKWFEEFPSFKKAFEAGMDIGRSNWRKRIADHAFLPTSQVNNGLIKMLSANVYKIKEDIDPAVVIHNNNNNTNNFDPEELLKKRGIPVPDVGIEDLE